MYALNRFYHGSAALTKDDSTEWRPLLVTKALAEGASKDFEHQALLLTNHADMLFEFISNSVLDAVSDVELLGPEKTDSHVSDAPCETAGRLKRRTRIQPSAKKVSL
jgi:hypothetical protein